MALVGALRTFGAPAPLTSALGFSRTSAHFYSLSLPSNMFSSTVTPELQDLRVLIDEIDEQVIALLARRFEATAKVGALKATIGLAAVDTAREESQRARYAHLAAKYGLSDAMIQNVFKTVISEVVSNHIAASSKAT
jgi:chorismate mutase